VTPENLDMRDAFFNELYKIAKNDKHVVLLAADMGAYSLEKFKRDLKSQFFNVGIAEQNMISVAAGLALNKKKVFVYTIIPFLAYRCYEQIRIDLCGMNLPVTIIGIGSGFSYAGDGPTHYAVSDISVMKTIPEITILNPSDSISAKNFARIAYESQKPTYIRIDKEKNNNIHIEGNDFKVGISLIKNGTDLTLISTGVMIHRTLDLVDKFESDSISTKVIELYRVKPIDKQILLQMIGNSKYIVTLEENSITGGIGNMISDILSDSTQDFRLKKIAIRDISCLDAGNREDLHQIFKLDSNSILTEIYDFFPAIVR
jgi:transketolase